MDKKVKKKWIQALKSGEYKQGHRYLCKDEGEGNRYCCLGVLADVVDPKGWHVSKAEAGERLHRRLGDYLNKTLSQRVGLGFGEQHILSGMNDGEGCDFHTIASWIEENL